MYYDINGKIPSCLIFYMRPHLTPIKNWYVYLLHVSPSTKIWGYAMFWGGKHYETFSMIFKELYWWAGHSSVSGAQGK